MAIRKHKDGKANDSLLRAGAFRYATETSDLFDDEDPIEPGTTRDGVVRYSSDAELSPPYAAVLFLDDPLTRREVRVAFVFGDGGQTLRDRLDQESEAIGGKKDAVTREVIADLLASGLSPQIVAAKIRKAGVAVDTSTASLKELKSAGFPDEVLLAIVESAER